MRNRNMPYKYKIVVCKNVNTHRLKEMHINRSKTQKQNTEVTVAPRPSKQTHKQRTIYKTNKNLYVQLNFNAVITFLMTYLQYLRKH